jgi:hypothetical protein
MGLGDPAKMSHGKIIVFVGTALSLLGCAALLNSNTMELASTVDSLVVQQVIYNLVKIKKNQFALPAQVQIPNGQVSTTLGASANVTTALNPLATATSQLASAGVAAPTFTRVTTNTLSGDAATPSATVTGMQDWVIDTVLDPEQLRRLRLLYQYATGQILAIDLLCEYPIPQKPDKSDGQQKDGSQGKGVNGAKPPQKGAKGSAGKSDNKVYIRGYECEHEPDRRKAWVTIGANPDFAFLNSPGCVLCAFDNKAVLSHIPHGAPIYDNVISDHYEPFEPEKHDYVQVVVNYQLLPNGDNNTSYDRKYWLPVDWLAVLGAGEPIPDNSKFVGSSSGYAVYVGPRHVEPQYRYTPPELHVPPAEDPEVQKMTGDSHFSEFVLAIIEATLQSPEIQKAQKPTPPVTQTLR